MHIIADTSRCVGAGQCVLTDPDVFDQSEEDGTVIVRVERPPDIGKAREAVHLCPSGALSLAED